MTVDFTQHPLVFYERSETSNEYVFSFEYLKTRDINVWTSLKGSRILTPLVEGVHYTITPVSGESGTVTIISITGPYDYVIIGRYYGYGQEYVMPAAYSGTITQNSVDGLGLQTQQLHARVKDIEDHGVGEGTPDYLTKFDTDGHTLKEAQISNPSGVVNVHVPMNTGNIASTGNISSSTLDVSGSATAGTMTVSASTSSGSLTVSGTSTLQDTSVKNLTLAEYLFTSNYRLFWQLENVSENQIMHFIKGTYTNPEDWAIANVNIDDVLGVRGTPNFLAKFNPTGKNVVDSRVVDPGTGAVTFSATIETEGATIISSDPVLTYSTGTTQTGFSVIPTSSFTKVAINATAVARSRLLTVQDTIGGVATLEFTDPPVSDVKPSTVNFVTYYDTDTTVSGKAGLIPGIPEATDAGFVLTAAGDGTADWVAPTGGGSGTVGPGIVGEYALFDSPNTITSKAGLLPSIPLAAEVDYVLRANNDGTANWEALGTIVSSVKPAITGQYAKYDTDTTVSGTDGHLPIKPTIDQVGFALVATGADTATWQLIEGGGGAVLKPGDMFATRNKSAITEQNGKLYESVTGYEVVRCDGQTLSYSDYSDILEHANMDVITAPGEPQPPLGAPADIWYQLNLEDGEGRRTIASAFGTKYDPTTEPDHFYVAQTYDKPHTLTKVFRVDSKTLSASKVQEIAYTGGTDPNTTWGHQGAYCYGKYYVVVYYTNITNIKIYNATNNNLLYTHTIPTVELNMSQITLEILDDNSLLIVYIAVKRPPPTGTYLGTQHILYDGNATFTAQPVGILKLNDGAFGWGAAQIAHSITTGDRAQIYACHWQNTVPYTTGVWVGHYILSTPDIPPVMTHGVSAVEDKGLGATGITGFDENTGYFPAYGWRDNRPACLSFALPDLLDTGPYTGGEMSTVSANRTGGYNVYNPEDALYFDGDTVYISRSGGRRTGDWVRSLTGVSYGACQVIASYFPVKNVMCTSGHYTAQTGTLAPMHVYVAPISPPTPVGILAPKLKEHYLVTANKAANPLTDRIREEVIP